MIVEILKRNLIKKSVGFLIVSMAFGCSPENEKSDNQEVTSEEVPEYGVGPITNDDLNLTEEIDQQLATQGKEVYDANCTVCHKFEQRSVGPPLKGITERRNPAWIMNMILNPMEMTKRDPIANELLREYRTQMVYQNISKEDSRAILEYMRKMDSQQ
jgi:mono/diheme cytochrome c family protein